MAESKIKTLQLLSTNRLFYNHKTRILSDSLLKVYHNNGLDIEGLKWYLELGYIPGKKTLFKDIEVIHNRPGTQIVDGVLVKGNNLYVEEFIDSNRHAGKSRVDLIREGGEIFNISVQNLYKNSNKKIIVPVTAGLDSRLILGGLLNSTRADNIIAYTWGTPGTMDFELSKKICRSLGIKHHLFDVTKYKLSTKRLIDYAINSDFSVPLFDHWPMEWVQDLVESNDGAIWIGLLGGSLSGANLPRLNTENAIDHFVKKNTRIKSTNLSKLLLDSRPDKDYLEESDEYKYITHDTLEIYYRNPNLLIPTMAHSKLEYIMPFSNPQILGFFLSLPFEYRVNRALMQEIIVKNYPHLAKFPSNRNNGMGLHIKGLRKKIISRYNKLSTSRAPLIQGGKYLSLKRIINQDKNIDELVKNKLENLRKRDLFINPNFKSLLDEFYSSGAIYIDHSRAIDALVSLEIFLEIVEPK